MDVRFSRDNVSLKKISLNVLCFYGAAYPLVAHIFMGAAGGGTIVVQLFQLLPILALVYLWRFRRKNGRLRSYVDVWTISIVYFSCVAIYFALFYAASNQFAEIVYAARFLSWFWLAATFKRLCLEPSFLERLAKSFWIGATSQCVLALWGRFWGFQNGLASTYSNVDATTGSADVSAKTVVAFVVLGMALSIYWFLVKRRMKLLYAVTILMGLAVVLCSYNRASQLGLCVAYCVALIACVRKRRFKAAGALLSALLVFVGFVTTSYGNKFMTRWESVASDHGSGRVAMIEIAGKCMTSPPSSEVFWFGRGVFQMQEMMYEEIGSRIGMHNDLLDFAIAYGLVGAALCLWAIYSALNFRKGVPRERIENYFSTSTAIFVALTGLFTGMFQATYVYFMLISMQYYFISQARLKLFMEEQERWARDMAWNDEAWREPRDDFEEWSAGFEEDADNADDAPVPQIDEKRWAQRGVRTPNYDCGRCAQYF